jgi:hypothetical protein
MNASRIDTLVDRLQAAAAGFAAQRQRLQAGEPWPLRDLERVDGAEAEWGPTEVLAHVAEMLPYWLGEAERVMAGRTDPVRFGRTAEDRIRTLTVARDRTLPVRELLDRISSGAERYARRAATLGPDDLARRGLHPTQGELTVIDSLERFVVSHAEGHVTQLAQALGPGADPG